MCSLCLAVQASDACFRFQGFNAETAIFLADFDRQTGKSRIVSYTSLFALFSLIVKRSILTYSKRVRSADQRQ